MFVIVNLKMKQDVLLLRADEAKQQFCHMVFVWYQVVFGILPGWFVILQQEQAE